MARKTSAKEAPPAAPPTRSLPRTSTALAVVAFLVFAATRIWLIADFMPQSSDLGLYFHYAEQSARAHEVPYQDFSIEYPPVAWWTMAAVYRMASATHPTAAASADAQTRFESYQATYRLVMSKLDIAAALLTFLILRRRAPRFAGGLFLAYVVCTATMAHVLYDRLDLELWWWLVAWAYCWVRALDGGPAEAGWTATAYAAFGAGIAYKLAPVVGLPVLLIAEWRHPRRERMIAAAAVGLAVGLGLPFVIQLAASGPGVFGFLPFYFGRPIQIESVYAALLEATRILGAEIHVTRTVSGYNVEGGIAPVLITLSSLVTIAFNAAVLLWAVRQPRGTFDRAQAYRAACLAIVGTVIVSKVVSPQFMVWALPLLLLFVADTAPNTLRWAVAVGVGVVAIAACSTWIFPYHYFPESAGTAALIPADLTTGWPPSPLAAGVVALRNAGYLALVIGTTARWWRTPTSSR